MEIKNEMKKFFINTWKNNNYIVVFIVLFLLAIIINPNFATYSNITNLFKQSAVIGILALGMSMIIISGNIDLSIGAAVCMVGAGSIEVLNATHSIILTFVFAITFGVVISLINGLLVARFKVPAFIATLSTMLIFRASTEYFASDKMGGQYIVSDTIFEKFRVVAGGNILTIPYLAIFFIVLSLIIIYIMENTKFGRYVYAVGGNEKSARLAGVNVTFIRLAVFLISGVLIGIASVLYSSRLTAIQPSSAGVGFELDAIAASVIGGISMAGGKGSLKGVIFGVLIFQIISTITVFAGIPPLLVGIVKGLVILCAVLAQRDK